MIPINGNAILPRLKTFRICDMKKMNKEPSIHDLAVRLCEGGQVEFFGLSIRAKDTPKDDDCCRLCEMDCLCLEDMRDLCYECDQYHGHQHYLELVVKDR